MKKYMMLVGLLAVFNLVSADEHTGNLNIVNVTAKVVEPLEVKTGDVNFGILAKNTTKTKPDVAGYIEVKGTNDEVIELTIKDKKGSGSTYNVNNKDNNYFALFNNDNSIGYFPSFSIQSGEFLGYQVKDNIGKNIVKLNDNGDFRVQLEGSVKAGTITGDFTGEAEVVVVYKNTDFNK